MSFSWKSLVVVGLIVSNNVFAQVTSDFATSDDGWTAPTAKAGSFVYTATGGNPNGYISGQTPGSTPVGAGLIWFPYFFQAPAKFLGNKSTYYGGNLRWDVSQTTAVAPVFDYISVQMTNAAGITYYYFPATRFSAPAFGSWTTVNVALSATGEWKTTNSTTGPAVTAAQLSAMLGGLQKLEIQGLYQNANVVTRIDNVTMYPPIVVSTNPTNQIVCEGKTATFTAVGTNNPNITYQWQTINPVTGAGTNLTNTGGYSGATTSTLSVNTTGNFGAGLIYRCKISGIGVDDKNSNSANLTVNALPTSPGATGDTSCGPNAFKLSATGGVAGQYRWYDVATNGTPFAGQTGNSYTTGIVSVTTDFYVAINNGTCESNRTKVTAVVNPIPVAPSTVDGISCNAGEVTLTASGGTDGQYRWYNDETDDTPIAGETNGTFKTGKISTDSTLYVSIDNGSCEGDRASVRALIIKTPKAPTVSVDGEDQSCSPSSFKLIGAGGDSYRWYTQASGGTADAQQTSSFLTPQISKTTTYYVTSANGPCESQRVGVTLTIGGPDCGIVIFNAVSPNKDGKNDVFYIKNIENSSKYKSNHVTIFNRWGDLVWDGRDYNNTTVVFSGLNKNNSELPSGTYYFKIEFASGEKMETGYIELKR